MCRLKFFFRWYDLWVGAYYDRKNRHLYLCPLPMIGVRIALGCPPHNWGNWCESTGRESVGRRYRLCKLCSAVDLGE